MTSPTLLLVHGLGATPAVWHDVIEALDWPGPVVTPTLEGHGDRPWSDDYSVAALALAAARDVVPDRPVIAVGHSLGGAVALALASGWFRPRVVGAIGVGIKFVWSEDDVTGMAKVAAKGVRWFGSREEAVGRYLLQAGLTGIVGPEHPAATDPTAVAEEDGRWRVAQDPATFRRSALDGPGFLAAARCPVILGAGDGDGMVSQAQLAALVPDPRIATGCGHNVHVEAPDWVASLVTEVAAHL